MPGDPARHSLDLLPWELQQPIYDLVFEDTAPRIFEVQAATLDKGPGPRSEPLHVVPSKDLAPPPILHAIPSARRYLLHHYMTYFGPTPEPGAEEDEEGEEKEEDVEDEEPRDPPREAQHDAPKDGRKERTKTKRRRGWLFNPRIDSLAICGAALSVFYDRRNFVPGVINVILRPGSKSYFYYQACATRLLLGFPNMGALTLCHVLPSVLREEGVLVWKATPEKPKELPIRGPFRECRLFAAAIKQQTMYETLRWRDISLAWLYAMKLDGDGQNVYEFKEFQPLMPGDEAWP